MHYVGLVVNSRHFQAADQPPKLGHGATLADVMISKCDHATRHGGFNRLVRINILRRFQTVCNPKLERADRRSLDQIISSLPLH